MIETRKLAAILVADIAGYSRLAGADENRILARLRGLRSDLFDPTIAVHHGKLVKRTGDGAIVEFRSALDAVGCAIELQASMEERNSGVAADQRIDFRIGIHVGDVVEESDGDLMGECVNIAARLESICEVGGVCISEDAYRQVRDRINVPFTDLGERSLKNIARPIRADAPARAVANDAASPQSRIMPLALPEKPSIVVLPFQNMSADQEQEYFADGMVEDITTGLSRIKWLFVIARNSSFAYKGKLVDVRQVGRELGVRYVLEGGVRKSGNSVRITAQLVEAETRAHLWADKFDGTLDNVFDLQDQITDRVVGIVEPSLQRSEIERSRRKRTENLDAYDLYLRALPHIAIQMPENAKRAMPLLEAALKLDPNFSIVHAHLAWCHELCFARDGFDEAHRTAGLQHARATIESATDDATALAVAGFVTTLLSREHETALHAVNRAISLNPSCATALYLGGQAFALAGHPEPAITYANRALRLSPFDPLAFQAHMALGEAALLEDRNKDAVLHFAACERANSQFSTGSFCLAIALTLQGRSAEAATAKARGLAIEPGFRIRMFFELGLAPALANKLAAASRLLGLPE